MRLVEIANGKTFSFEVCGGTHVERTGELGSIIVLGESSIGSGMRRIEAVSGRESELTVRRRFRAQEATASRLNTTPLGIEDRVELLLGEVESLRRDNEKLERELGLQEVSGMLGSVEKVGDISLLTCQVNANNSDSLREMGDWLRNKMGSGIVVLGSLIENRPQLVVMITKDIVEKGIDAVVIAKNAGKEISGGGGGRVDIAQAGGRNAEGLDKALESVKEFLNRQDV